MVGIWKLSRYVDGGLWKEEGRDTIRPTAQLRSAAKSGMRHEVEPSNPPRLSSTAIPARSSIPQRRRGKPKEEPIGRSATRICQDRSPAASGVRMAVRRRRYTRYGDGDPSGWRSSCHDSEWSYASIDAAGLYLRQCSMPGYLLLRATERSLRRS
ncbi:hypothetical protein K523DRAFT_20661 [Schizophyllum commune Tattone D]|nr:hypothetical protein K523DRAFT_20661 [Schizophyllum commune Tattone D]